MSADGSAASARVRLQALIEASLERAVPPAVAKTAARLAARFGAQSAAVLFYGSCLRSGVVAGMVLDFYLLVDDDRTAYGRWLPALGNRLAPPNVHYLETAVAGETVRAKYAVLALAHFRRLAGPGTFNVALWARFSQPVALVYCRDAAARGAVVAALADAHVTLIGRTRALAPADGDALARWRHAFALTYGCEFRAESRERPSDLVAAEAAYYRALDGAVLAALAQDTRFGAASARRQRWAWRLRALQGRGLHLARLVKAAFTFDGGIDYLAWKIARHSGVAVAIKPWHRRHPLLAGLWLFAYLRLKGAFR